MREWNWLENLLFRWNTIINIIDFVLCCKVFIVNGMLRTFCQIIH